VETEANSFRFDTVTSEVKMDRERGDARVKDLRLVARDVCVPRARIILDPRPEGSC